MSHPAAMTTFMSLNSVLAFFDSSIALLSIDELYSSFRTQLILQDSAHEGQMVDSLTSAGHMVSVTATQLCPCWKAAIDSL